LEIVLKIEKRGEKMKNKMMFLLLLSMLISVAVFAEGQSEDKIPTLEEIGFSNTGMPIVESAVEIEVLMSLRPQMESADSFTILDDIAAASNVNINKNGIPMSIYDQKRQLLLASLDFPDVFWGSDSISKEMLFEYGKAGYILRLNEYIDEYMPNLKAFLDENPIYREKLKDDDGNIYYLPKIQQIEPNPLYGRLFINKTWLDELNLPVPETLEQYTAALQSFRDNDPNGNGIQDEIPLILSEMALGSANISSISVLFGSFGRHGNGFIIEDNKVVFAPAEREYQQAINYFNTYFRASLVNSDAAILSILDLWKVYKTDTTNRIGSTIGFGKDAVPDEFVDEYVVLEPLEGPDGDKVWHRKMDIEGSSIVGAAVYGKTAYPEVVMRFLDLCYETEKSIELHNGPLGIMLKKNADNSYDFADGIDNQAYWREVFKHTTQSGPYLMPESFYEDGIAPNPYAENLKDYFEKYEPFDVSYIYPNLTFDKNEGKLIQQNMVDINNYVIQSKIDWLLGKGVSDEEFDKYQEILSNMGLDNVLEIYQNVLNRNITSY